MRKVCATLPMCYSNSSPTCFANSAHFGVQFVTPSPNVGPLRRTPILGPIRHTPSGFFPPPIGRTCRILFPFIANRIFCRYISCTGAFLLFAPLWARSSSSSTRPSSRPRTQSAGRRTTTSGMHTASSTYQIRVSSISTTLGERGVSFLSFFSDKSLKYLHDFGGERCFF